MSDSHTSSRPHHTRSSSISKNARSHSHQRKPSVNSTGTPLYSIQEIPSSKKPTTQSLTTSSSSSSSSSSSWKQSLYSLNAKFNSLFETNPSGPLLPQDKHTTVFGGTSKTTNTSWLGVLGRSTIVRLFILFYFIFSVFLSLHHLWIWFHTERLDSRFGDDWVPQRTYDQQKSYSVIDDMTHGLKMSKLFAKSNIESTENVQPYWLKASGSPSNDDVTIVTVITANTWSELEILSKRWNGFISATLHMETGDEESKNYFREQYAKNTVLSQRVDIHLSEIPRQGRLSVLLPRNAERNLARLLARSEYVMELASNMVPATDIQRTLNTNKEMFEQLLKNGDVLVLPMFGFPTQDGTVYKIPHSKDSLLQLVDNDEVYLLDKHWKPNTGPTDLDTWKVTTNLYSVERYDFHYEPIVIESKTVQPWCSERFLDSRSACLLETYLSGGEFWVLPDDYVIVLPETEKATLTDFDSVIENRLYAKFYWEQCVYHARQLDALGLWKGKRSLHIRTQCSRVIQNWGKGLIGKPE